MTIDNEVLASLARLVEREKYGSNLRPRGDILEQSVRKKNQCGGNSAKLTTSYGIQSQTGVQFQLREIPPDVYTVKVSALDLPPFIPGEPLPILASTLATIIFGANGQQTVRRVSVNQGVSVSGQADFINVMVTDNTPAFTINPPPFQYHISITVAPGLRADTFGPPTLSPYDANGFLITPGFYIVPSGGFQVILIPQNVGVISTQTTVTSAIAGVTVPEGAAFVEQIANGTLVLATYDPRDAPGWIPLRSGAQAIVLNNQWAALNSVIFSLVFGIDG